MSHLRSKKVLYDPSNDPVTDDINVQDALQDHAASIEQRVASMSGVVTGGVMSINTPTTFDITDGTGEIYNSYTIPGNTSIIEFGWSGLTNIVLTIVGTAGSTDIFLNSSGTVVEVAGQPTGTQFRELVHLGTIYHSGGAITDILNAPAIVKQTSTDSYDNMRHTTEVAGSTIHDVTGQLQVWLEAGEVFFPGVNWNTDRTNPNFLALPAEGSDVLPITVQPMTQTGLLSAGITDMPMFYNDTGDNLVALIGQQAVIHRLYNLGINNREFFLLYGQSVYQNAQEAKDNLLTDEENIVFPAEVDEMFFLGWICVNSTASDFSNIDQAWIVSRAGTDSSSGGGGAGGDHSILSNRLAPDQHNIQSVTSLEALLLTLIPAGYGSMVAVNVAGFGSLPNVFTDITAYVSDVFSPNVGVVTNLATGTIALNAQGGWQSTFTINVDHLEVNSSREMYLRLFNKTTATPGIEWTVPIARNQSATLSSLTFLTDIAPANVGNEFVIQIRTDDGIDLTFMPLLNWSVNHIGSLATIT